MRDERLEQLLWERIDRVIAPEELEELESYLESDRAGVRRASEVETFATLLNEVEEVETPPELAGKIANALADKRVAGRDSASWWRALGGFWGPRPALRFGSLAAAALLGAVGYHLIVSGGSGPQPDNSKLYGTAGLLSETETRAGARTVDLPDSAGALALHRRGSLFVADLAFAHAGDAALSLTVDSGFRLESTTYSGDPTHSIHTSDRGFTFDFTGPGRFVFSATIGSEARELGVRVVSEGSLLFVETFRLDELPEIRE